MASATVLGLAIGFGSQGLVQDVVIGLTLIFSDVLDVGTWMVAVTWRAESWGTAPAAAAGQDALPGPRFQLPVLHPSVRE